MTNEYKILMVLVVTFCLSILMCMLGVFLKLVDPQFVEGLITGGLVGMITMLFKDILGKHPGEGPQVEGKPSDGPQKQG